MARVREVGLVREKNRHGNIKWVYREPRSATDRKWGKRTTIRGEYGSPAFKAALAAAKGYATATATKGLTHTDSGSLAWLVDQYVSSSAWTATAAATQKQRRNILARVVAKNIDSKGSFAVRDLDRDWVEEVRDAVADDGRATAMANAVVKVLRVLFKWATPRHMPVNIARDVDLISRDEREGFHSWTEDELAQFEAFYRPGTRERLAYSVLLWTGQRRGDCVKFGKQHARNGRLVLRQGKTGNPVTIPVMPELAEALAAGPVGDLCWIVGDKGQPITADTFTGWFRQVCNKAGLKQCSAHGLRKAAARRFAERGATVDELKAWFGWTENRTPGIYTRDADNARLADNAARRMRAA
jgi:integrase